MRLFFLYLIISLVLIGCESRTDYKRISFDKFPESRRLFNEEISTPPVLFSVVGMTMLDSVLITVDIQTDTIFRVFKLPDFLYLGGFVERGNGPDQEVMVFPYLNKVNYNAFYYEGLIALSISSYDLESEKIKQDSSIRLPGSLMDYYPVLLLDSVLIGCDMNNRLDCEFIKYNPSSNTVSNFGPKFPELENKIHFMRRNALFAKLISAKPTKDYFASVYDKFPLLRIYTSKGILYKEVYFENGQIFPDALLTDTPAKQQVLTLMQNYRVLQSTNNYIYALYIGKTTEELGKESIGINDYSNTIHVWDWNGNPIMEITLDNDIFTFCVAPDDNYIICSSVNKLNGLYKYSLAN